MAEPASTNRSKFHTATTTTQSSSLLTIAPEPCNNIYRLALTTNGKVKIDMETFLARKNLLETCSQIRQEAHSI